MTRKLSKLVTLKSLGTIGSAVAGEPYVPISGIFVSYLEVQETDPIGTLIGYVYPIDGQGPYTYELISNPGGLVQFDVTIPYRLEVAADLTGQTTFDIGIRITDGQNNTAEDTITITVVADTSNGSGVGEGDGTVIDDGGFDIVPVPGNTGEGLRISGKNGGYAAFIFDIGAPVADGTYIFRYSADWSQMSKLGREAMIGIGFKDGDDFHLTGLRGDGASPTTTMLRSKAYGSFAGKAKNFTITNDGAATDGTKDGPNWIRVDIASDGLDYTFYTSPDGIAWTAQYTDAVPVPLANATDAVSFGIGGYFTKDDKGPFALTIEQYQTTAPHRYWRWNFTEQFGTVTLQQIELFEATGGDVSGEATMTASSTLSGAPANTTDNLQTTFWRANGSVPQWLKADFGPGNEKKIVLGALWQMETIKTVNLQWSDNNTDWTNLFNPVTFASAVPGVWTGRFFGLNGLATESKRIWRVRVNASNGYNGVIIKNLEFRTSLGGSDETVPNNQLGPALDSVFSGNLPSFGFNDSTANQARSNNGFPAWLQYDFGFTNAVANVKEIVQIAMTASTTDAPKDFDVQYSTDGGATFVTAWSAFDQVGWGTNETRVFNVTTPSQFGIGDWSVADKSTGGTITITITDLPYHGGSAITDLEYQIDGGSWVSLAGTTTGDYDVSGLTNDVRVDVSIRAVNAIGNGTASVTKAAVPKAIPEYRYHRIYFNDSFDSGSIGLADIQLLDAGGSDFGAAGFTFPGHFTVFYAHYMFDANEDYNSNYWNSPNNTVPKYLYIEQKPPYQSYEEIVIKSRNTGTAYPTNLDIVTSDDAVVWTVEKNFNPAMTGASQTGIFTLDTPSAAKKYFGVRINATADSGWMASPHMEFRKTVGQAEKVVPAVSGVFIGNNPWQSRDGNNSTFWTTGGPGPNWIAFDAGYGLTRGIKTLKMRVRPDAQRQDPLNWLFQGSNDFSNWDTLFTGGPEATWVAGEERSYVLTGDGNFFEPFDNLDNLTYEETVAGGVSIITGGILQLKSSASLYSWVLYNAAQIPADWSTITIEYDVRPSSGTNCDHTVGLVFDDPPTGAVTVYNHSNRALEQYAQNIRGSSFSEIYARQDAGVPTTLRDVNEVSPANNVWTRVVVIYTKNAGNITRDIEVGGVPMAQVVDTSANRKTGACHVALSAFASGQTLDLDNLDVKWTVTGAPPQLIGFDINRSFTYTNLTISKPSGTVSGSLLVAHIGVGNPSVKAIPPEGWVHVRTGVFGNARSSVFYKIAGGSEPASYTFQIDDVGRKAGAIIRVEGYDAANIVHKEGLTGANSNSNPANTPSVTTTINNCLILRFANAGWNGFTFTPPSGVTEIYDTANAAGGSVGSSITGGWENLATAGASGVKGFTISSSAHYSGITMAVAPSGGSAPTVESFASALDETVSFSQAVKDLGLPSGAAEGDVLIAAVAGGDNTTLITPPAGWTQIAATQQDRAYLAVFRKVVSASETTPYVFTSNDGTAQICAGIVAFRNIDTVTPVIDHAENGSPINTNTVAMTGLVLSGSQAIQLQIAAAGWGQSNQIHPGIGMTHVFSFSPCVNNVSNPGLYLEYALRNAPATYGESLISAQSFHWSTMNLLLNPAGI